MEQAEQQQDIQQNIQEDLIEQEPVLIDSLSSPEKKSSQENNENQRNSQKECDSNSNDKVVGDNISDSNKLQQQDNQLEQTQQDQGKDQKVQNNEQQEEEENKELQQQIEQIQQNIENLDLIKCQHCDNKIDGLDATIQYCDKCLEDLILLEEEQIEQLDKSIQQYDDQLQEIQQDLQESQNIQQDFESKNIQQQEQMIDQQLKELQEIELQQNGELQVLKNEVLKLEMKESEYWSKINNHQKNFVKLEEKIQQADNYLKKLNQDIININQINVLNDVFYIFVDEQAGTINNLIIGKKREQQNVDWDSTNAALGQLAVLFTYLKQKFNYKYQLIEYIMCNGNSSSILTKSQHQKQSKCQSLNLYGPLGRELSEDNFNTAISFLVMEFKQFCDYMSELDSVKKKNIQIELPYDISGEYIISGNNSYSVNTNNYKEAKWDHWTQTMKYLLADFKYIITVNAEFDRKAEQEYIKQL